MVSPKREIGWLIKYGTNIRKIKKKNCARFIIINHFHKMKESVILCPIGRLINRSSGRSRNIDESDGIGREKKKNLYVFGSVSVSQRYGAENSVNFLSQRYKTIWNRWVTRVATNASTPINDRWSENKKLPVRENGKFYRGDEWKMIPSSFLFPYIIRCYFVFENEKIKLPRNARG